MNISVFATMIRRSCRFYSKATTDFEYSVPVRLGRALGHRRPHGLRPDRSTRITAASRWNTLTMQTNEKYIPYVIEPSLGADRVALAFLIDAYDEEPP